MNQEITMLGRIWRQKSLAVIGAVLGFAVGAGYLSLSHPRYTSTMIVTAAHHGVSNLSDSTSRGTSLASTIFGTAQNPDFMLILELLHSEKLARVLQEKYHLLQQFHPGAWDADANQWRRPDGLVASVTQRVNVVFGRPAWSPPDALSLSQELTKAIKVEQDVNKGFYEITFSAGSPELARDVLDEVIKEAELLARTNALQAAASYVQFLDNELKFASNDETRRSLTDLYLQQEQRKMVLSANAPFAAEVVTGPTLATRPAGLSPSVMLFVSTIFGAAVFGALGFYRSSQEAKEAFEEHPATV